MRVIILIFILIFNLFAWETYNLEIIFIDAEPEIQAFGACLSSGDLNGDSYSDVIAVGSRNPNIYFGGPNMDTIPDLVIRRGVGFLACVGDINNDGFEDLALGNQHAGEYGSVMVYFGGNPMDTICDLLFNGPLGAYEFGTAIAWGGNINGDGYDDFIVGAYRAYTRPGFAPGRVFIYFGGPNLDTLPDVILNGGHNGIEESFGWHVSGGGDVNDDGFDDVFICAPDYGAWEGRIYIYYGGNPIDTTPDVMMRGEHSGQFLGENRGGFIKNYSFFDHTIFGDPDEDYTNPLDGKVYTLYGGNPMDSIPDICWYGREDTSELGFSTGSVGRINGDLDEDFGCGAVSENRKRGCAYIYLGGREIDTIPDAWIKGEVTYDYMGSIVSAAGDVDGDGKDEILVSNYVAHFPERDRVFICKYTGPGGVKQKDVGCQVLDVELNIQPNIIRKQSVIRFRCPSSVSRKELKVYDIKGRLIKSFSSLTVSGERKGESIIVWDLKDEKGRKVSNGIYLIELVVGKKRKVEKIIVVR